MTDDAHLHDSASADSDLLAPTGARRRRWCLVVIVLALVLAIIVVPPLVNVGRYKSRITALISASLDRPVRLASVELRLFPWPGFVLTDLSVAEDPAYGAEPVLHANTVRASIRLLPLWRGRLEIGTISVDEATLNLVRAAPGEWNLDPLFRTAAAKAGAAKTGGNGGRAALPYLEATDSRINIKYGAEKLPFSLMNTNLSFWQENPGEWRIRLRGQPTRTDVALDMGDTGIVRLEASIGASGASATALQLMPIHADLDWREAQLGQLSRLVLGVDPGWRGDLTGEAHLSGTPDAAHITMRLRATGVHRAEFAPPSPLDFDANCSFVYHYPQRAVDDLACNSPLGDGRLRLTGDIPANAPPDLTLELDRVPAAAGLDALRTMRSGIAPDLEAGGTVSGKLAYATPAPTETAAAKGARSRRRTPQRQQGPLTGSATIEDFTLSGGGLSQPLRASKIVLQPAMVLEPAEPGAPGASTGAQILEGTVAIPAGGATQLVVNARLALYGYETIVRGQASIARAREIVQMAGQVEGHLLAGLAGEPISVNLTAQGPWLPEQTIVPLQAGQSVASAGVTQSEAGNMAGNNLGPRAARKNTAAGPALTAFDRGIKPSSDSLVGTVALHNAIWRADYLASPVEIAQATLHVSGTGSEWAPVVFSYGPVKGTASITLPAECAAAAADAGAASSAAETAPECEPQFQAQFGALDGAVLQQAFLGARRQGTVLSKLIDRLSSSSAPPWPAFKGTIKADSLALGPVTLKQASAAVAITGNNAAFTNIAAGLLGGQFQGSGTVRWGGSDGPQPAYSVEGHLEQASPAAVGQLLAMRWSDGAMKLDGSAELAGFTAADLTSSAKGKLHFDWRHGALGGSATSADVSGEASDEASAETKAGAVPAILAHFDEWSGEAKIAGGAITLGDNQVTSGRRHRPVHAAIQIAEPPKVQFGVSNVLSQHQPGQSASK